MFNILRALTSTRRNVTPTLETVYHATSASAARTILNGKGIVPRALLGTASRFTDYPSNPECVYLTYSHGAYHAGSIAGGEHAPDGKRGERDLLPAAIFEIDGTMLDVGLCYPDEDYLEQAGRSTDSVAGRMYERTAYYRDNMFSFAARHKECFNAVGSIAYRGIVSVNMIKRVTYIDWDAFSFSVMMKIHDKYFMGGSPALDDYPYHGASQRELTKLFFGDTSFVNEEKYRISKAITVVRNKKYRKP